MGNRVEEIRKLASSLAWHRYTWTDNPADFVTGGAKVSKFINDPAWLLGTKWLNFPPELWPKSEDKEIIGENELEYRKEPSNILKCEYNRRA